MSDDLLISTIAGLEVHRDNGSGHLTSAAWGRKKKRQSTLHRSLGKSIGPNFSIVQVSHLSHCNRKSMSEWIFTVRLHIHAVSHTHTHTHTHTYLCTPACIMHVHVCMCVCSGGGGVDGWGECVHAWLCVCVCMVGGGEGCLDVGVGMSG